jgi:hypothetical protein
MASRPILTVKESAGSQGGKPGETLREYCDSAAQSMMRQRKDVDNIVGEIAGLTMPMSNRFTPRSDNRRRKSLINRLYDGYGIRASEILTNGMTSGLSSPSRPWYRTKAADPDLMNFHTVRLWFEAVDRVMYGFMNATNFYGALKAGYGELGNFGTEAAFMADHWKAGMVTHSMTFGEYWLGVGDELTPDRLLRSVPLSTRQVVSQFVASPFNKRDLDWSKVSPSVKQAWDGSSYERSFDIMHLVEPNPAWDPRRFDAAGKPWRSCYWEAGSDKQKDVLSSEGHEEQPFWAARWNVTGNDIYGSGPGWNALFDLRGLQAQAKRKGDATDMAIKPPMIAPASVKIKMTPGSVTHASQLDKDSVRPVVQVDYRAIEVVGRDVKDCRSAVGEFYFVDLFMAITDMDGVQPRNESEIFSRNEEKMTQLGPVIERVNNEKLGVAIDRVFGICLRRGMFPPAPPELHGVEIRIEYISILAQAQRAAGLGVTERSLGFVGNLAKAFPGVADNIDADAVVLDYLDRAGFPIIGIRDPKDRDAMRAARVRDQVAEQARANAPALKQAAEGAQLLSQTDMRGQPALDTVLGALGG